MILQVVLFKHPVFGHGWKTDGHCLLEKKWLSKLTWRQPNRRRLQKNIWFLQNQITNLLFFMTYQPIHIAHIRWFMYIYWRVCIVQCKKSAGLFFSGYVFLPSVKDWGWYVSMSERLRYEYVVCTRLEYARSHGFFCHLRVYPPTTNYISWN